MPAHDRGPPPPSRGDLLQGHALSSSCDSRSASLSSAWSAPSPSAVSTTSSLYLAPSVIRPSTLDASTGPRPASSAAGLAICTGTPCSLTARTNTAAGRACKPTLLAILARRSAIVSLLVVLIVRRVQGPGSVALPCRSGAGPTPAKRVLLSQRPPAGQRRRTVQRATPRPPGCTSRTRRHPPACRPLRSRPESSTDW